MKKLLLILLCLPFIGFGQKDTPDQVILINNDTLSVIVTEINNKSIKYKYIDEKLINTLNTSKIDMIKFGSGRVQYFKKELSINRNEISFYFGPSIPSQKNGFFYVPLEYKIRVNEFVGLFLNYNLNSFKIFNEDGTYTPPNRRADFMGPRMGFALHFNNSEIRYSSGLLKFQFPEIRTSNSALNTIVSDSKHNGIEMHALSMKQTFYKIKNNINIFLIVDYIFPIQISRYVDVSYSGLFPGSESNVLIPFESDFINIMIGSSLTF